MRQTDSVSIFPDGLRSLDELQVTTFLPFQGAERTDGGEGDDGDISSLEQREPVVVASEVILEVTQTW